MKIEGTIHDILPQEEYPKFTKRSLILQTDEQYPQLINIEFQQKNVDLIDPYAVGMQVCVHINLRGREWTSPTGEVKYFNTIVGWRIENLSGQVKQESPYAPEPLNPVEQIGDAELDDLPF